jgi:predicted kinase
MKPTLYLIRGVPGAGKSTFANNLLRSGVVDTIACADDYMIDGNGRYSFNPTNLHFAHRQCYAKAKISLIRGDNVAVANTNVTEWEVEKYVKLTEECGANLVSIIVENRHGSFNIHGVPDEKIQQMKQRFSIKL